MQLYVQRLKVANDDEKERLLMLNANYMSDEEDGDEEGVWIVKSPTWRSRELNRLISSLQTKISQQASKHPKNKRNPGPPCERPQPSNRVPWAITEPQLAARQRQQQNRHQQGKLLRLYFEPNLKHRMEKNM